MPVRVKGIEAAIDFNERLMDTRNYEQLLNEILIDTVSLIRSRAPVDTGALLNSISFVRSGTLAYRIIVDVPYAFYMEYGFNGKVFDNIQNPIFLKSGYHPFLRSSIWEINNLFSQYIRRIVFKK